MEEIPKIFTYSERSIDPEIIKKIIDPELSEPYSVFTYYFFLQNHPQFTYLIFSEKEELIGLLIGKIEECSKEKEFKRGYLAMIVITKSARRKGLGKLLMQRFIDDLLKIPNCTEIILETECLNTSALRLYECGLISI